MITVAILINGHPITARSASNISPVQSDPRKVNHYLTDAGDRIEHVPDDGVVALAIKMLQTIEEIK